MGDWELPPKVLTLGLVSLANLSLGALVYWRYRAFRLLRAFAYNALCIAAYCIFVAGLGVIRTQPAAEAWVRALVFVPHLTILTMVNFSLIFARAEGRWTRLAMWVGAFLFLIEVLARSLGIAPVMLLYVPGTGWMPQADPFYSWVYLPTFFSLMFMIWGLVVRRRMQSKDLLERQQLASYFVAITGMVLVTLLDIFPTTSPYSTLAPLVYLCILAYGITRRNLFDIDLFLRKGAVLAAVTSVLMVVFGLALFLGRHAWSGPTQSNNFAAIITVLVLVLTYDAIKSWTARALDRLVGKKSLDLQAKLVEYALLISSAPRLDDFLQSTCRRLHKDLDLTHAAIWVRDRTSALVPAASFPLDREILDPEMAADDPILEVLRERPRGLDLDSLAWTHAYDGPHGQGPSAIEADFRDILKQWGFHAAIPLKEGTQLTGLLLVGPPASGRSFNDSELSFLSALAVQLATAIQNSLLHRQVQQADRLSTLGTLSASLAHEIRNPLTAISTFVQMLGARHHDPVFLEKFERVVGSELGKLTRLTEQLLTFARPSASRRTETDLNQLSERVHQLLHSQFARKGVSLSLELGADPAWVRANEAELSQVLINLVINALQATAEGGQVKVQTLNQGSLLRLRVTDNGVGMSSVQLKRLFEPFFSTKDGGTGLGLTTCQRIVEEHGGEVQVESSPGLGSTFSLSFPLVGPATKTSTDLVH